MDQALDLAMANALTQVGADATFYHNNESSNFDPATGKTSGSASSETVKAIITTFESSQVDGQVVRRDDLKVLINANEFTGGAPIVDDEIEDKNGNRYKVIGVFPRKVEHEPISYILQARQ